MQDEHAKRITSSGHVYIASHDVASGTVRLLPLSASKSLPGSTKAFKPVLFRGIGINPAKAKKIDTASVTEFDFKHPGVFLHKNLFDIPRILYDKPKALRLALKISKIGHHILAT